MFETGLGLGLGLGLRLRVGLRLGLGLGSELGFEMVLGLGFELELRLGLGFGFGQHCFVGQYRCIDCCCYIEVQAQPRSALPWRAGGAMGHLRCGGTASSSHPGWRGST